MTTKADLNGYIKDTIAAWDAYEVPYAMFSDSTTQAIANPANAQVITFNTDEVKNGITHSTVTNPGRVTIPTAGAYLITVSAIVDVVSGAVPQHINVWMRVGGSDVARSNTIIELNSAAVEFTLAVSFIYVFTANQYFELWMYGSATTVQLLATAAGTNPTRPACPSIIMTVNKVSG